MRMRKSACLALAVMTVAGAAVPAFAQSSGYTVSPAGPADPRNNYVPQAGAVFVVDNAKGKITMCFPDTQDSKVVVVCTPASNLP